MTTEAYDRFGNPFAANASEGNLIVVREWFAVFEWLFITGSIRYLHVRTGSFFMLVLWIISNALLFTYCNTILYRAYETLSTHRFLKRFTYTAPQNNRPTLNWILHLVASGLMTMMLSRCVNDVTQKIVEAQGNAPAVIQAAPSTETAPKPQGK